MIALKLCKHDRRERGTPRWAKYSMTAGERSDSDNAAQGDAQEPRQPRHPRQNGKALSPPLNVDATEFVPQPSSGA